MDAVSDVSHAQMVIIPTVLTTVIAVILTLLRLYVRVWMIKLFGWDDLFNVLAMLTLVVVMGLVLGAVHFGLGRHFKFVDPARAAQCVKLLRIAEFIVIVSTVLVKISISLFLKRLFPTNKRWTYFFWGFIAFNSITSLLDAAAIFPQCTPVELNWNKSIPGHCWSDEAINAIGIAQGSIAAVTDITLSILPTIFLWNIKINRKVKVGVCAIMALGFASGGFAIARTYLVPSLTATHDPTWDLVPLFTWAVLEASFGVIAAAAPSLRPLLGFKYNTTSYGKSNNSRSHSLPLHNMPNTGPHRSHLSFSGARTKPRDPNELSDEDLNSDGASGELSPWAPGNNGILKTTDVHIVRSQPPNAGEDKPRSSSVEKLVHNHN